MSLNSDYWSRVISHNFCCEDCGGAVRKTGGAPIRKGSITAYKCIRCGSTGTVKSRITWDSRKLNGVVPK